MVFPILPTNTLSGGYDIDNSCRFIDSSYLTRDNTTQSGAGDNFTFSAWLKMSTYGDGGYQGILSIFKDSNDYFEVYKDNGSGLGTGSENLQIQQRISGTGVYYQIQHFEFADYSAWYHLVINFNNSESNEVDKVSIYVNGTEIQGAVSNSNPFDDVGLGDSAYDTRIGAYRDNTTGTWNGYMADVHLIAGSTLTASSFGETNDDGIWIPKEAKDDLTFGTNGFFLEFKETGTSQNSSGIGADTSGEDNHLAVTNLAATNQTTDTPTNNFCTLNPIWTGAGGTISEGNTKLVSGSSEYGPVLGTIAMTSGKWYWEVLCTTFNFWRTGIADVTLPLTTSWNLGYESSPDNAVYRDLGYVGKNGSNILSGQPSLAVDETVSVAFDADSGKIWFAQDGTWINSGDPAAGSNEATSVTAGESYFPALSDGSDSTSSTYSFNFGNPPHSISSGNADGAGYGNFEFDVPAGFYALCTKNLARYGG